MLFDTLIFFMFFLHFDVFMLFGFFWHFDTFWCFLMHQCFFMLFVALTFLDTLMPFHALTFFDALRHFNIVWHFDVFWDFGAFRHFDTFWHCVWNYALLLESCALVTIQIVTSGRTSLQYNFNLDAIKNKKLIPYSIYFNINVGDDRTDRIINVT